MAAPIRTCAQVPGICGSPVAQPWSAAAAARSAPSASPVCSATDRAKIACRSGGKDQGEIPVSASGRASAIVSANASADLARERSPASAAELAS